MVLTCDVFLPSIKSLSVAQEVNLSTSTLLSAGPYLGKYCEAINNEFMLCRYELDDPRACVDLGKKVTACTLEFFRKVKNNCCSEFNQYANCVDKSSGDRKLRYCRNTQAVFDTCMQEKLDMERPEFGYFCRGRVHTTSREETKDETCPCTPAVPDPTPQLPDCKSRPPARFTSRLYWMTE